MSTAQPLRPPLSEINNLPPLLDFRYTKTRIQVFTHRSYHARPTAVFEDPPDDIAPDNEVLEFLGDSVLSLAVATLVRATYSGLRVGPHAKIRALVVQNATIAQISRHYHLADHLRANNSQIVNLRHSTSVQADLFEAYIGGLHADWGYEHIRPWLFRVLRPYIDEAYRTVQKDYLPGKGGRSYPTPAVTNNSPQFDPGSPLRQLTPRSTTYDPSVYDAASPKQNSPHRSMSSTSSPSHMYSGPALTGANLARLDSSRNASGGPPLSKQNLGLLTPAQSVRSKFSSSKGSTSAGSVSGYNPLSSMAESPEYAPSAIPEGHLPLLNQVLQSAKRWIDWDFERDTSAPITTPIWNAKGRMSDIIVCQGRGNTKRLAKSEAARALVTELQFRLGTKPCTTPYLAKELNDWWQEKTFEQPLDEEPEQISSAFGDLNIHSEPRSHRNTHVSDYYTTHQMSPYN